MTPFHLERGLFFCTRQVHDISFIWNTVEGNSSMKQFLLPIALVTFLFWDATPAPAA